MSARHALDIPAVRAGEHAGLLLDQVLDIQFARDRVDHGPAFVGILAAQCGKLLLDNSHNPAVVAEDQLQFPDFALDLGIFGHDLFNFQAAQAPKLHLHNGLGLDLGKVEALDQVLFRVGDRA